MDITEVSILHHIVIALAFLWILSYFSLCPSIVYFLSFVYLYLVNERYTLKLQKRLQFEERKQANQRRLLSDSETVRWLNHAVEKVWPICMEQIASQKFLLPVVPWFLEKYKPWTVKTAVVQQLYLGRSPPMFTEIRVLGQSADDDHLVLELGMNFLSADDMSSVLAVKLRNRLGGMWAKMHITGMHLEGKVLVGVKFLRQWPFLGRLRVCFAEPPYFQMTVKPIFNHGVNVTELPGIAGWLDKILSIAFEQTLVEPNMLVVDVEKFASAPTETWFSVDEKCPIAFVKVEILEAADMKPSDLNGLADPYVKGQLGPHTFRTGIQRKTLTPKWQEEFKIPIFTWESLSVLHLRVHDKDHIFDDSLGDCSMHINDFRDGQRHDKWLPLQNIKTGRLHLAVTVVDVDEKEGQCLVDEEGPNQNENMTSVAGEAIQHETSGHTPSSGQDLKMADEFEPINIEGQEKTGVWVHRPGSDVSQTWEPRKRSGTRRPVIEIHRQGIDSIDSPGLAANGSHDNDSSDDDENPQLNKEPKLGAIRKSLRKFGSIFHKSATNENHNEKGMKDENPNDKGEVAPTPCINIQAVRERGTGVMFVLDDDQNTNKESPTSERNGAEGPDKGQVRGMAKGIIKQAGKSAALNIKHALRRKGSKKTTADPGSPTTERDASQGSDVIDEESLSSSNSLSPGVESISVNSASLHGSGKQSAGTEKETVVGLGPSASAVDIMNPIARKVSFRGGDGTGNNTASTGESLVVEVSLGDTDSTVGDNGIQREFVKRDASISGADGMKDDGMVGCTDGHGQGDIEASSDSKVLEGTL